MPLREDELASRGKDDLRYCIVCEKYLSPIAWAEHAHNPNAKKPLAPTRPAPAISTIDLLLGNCALGNTSGVLVIEGVEVFRLRHRGDDGHITVDLDLRAPEGQLAKVDRNKPLAMAPGLALDVNGGEVAVSRQGMAIARVTLHDHALRLTGEFFANGLRVVVTGDSLTIDGKPAAATRLYGPGTAVLIRRGKAIGFAKK
ncbi:MAG: hypothetical protein HY261_09210 [Chloroflexi bacterium]|nr:hypothetical protein [Chloroflexota bacterium]